MPAAAAEDPMEDALQQPLVRLMADGRERQSAVARRVVADRGLLRLQNRHLQPHGTAHGDHLRKRLGRPVRGEVRDPEPLDALVAAATEGGQRQGDQEHDRQEREEREPSSAPRRAHLPTFDAPPPSGA
jgi:hypothetical protein